MNKSRSTQHVSRPEWRWVIKWIIVALIITSLPYLIGLARSTPERVYGGFAIAIEDGNSYLAKMNEGAHGLWLFHLVYTSEPHTGAVFFLFYFLLGKFAVFAHLPLITVFHLSRLICAGLLLLVLYRFIALFAVSRAVQRIAFLLIVFSGGLGWLLFLIGQPNWLGSPPIDLISPEAFTFLTLYAFPHIALARMFLLLGFILLWSDDPRYSVRHSVGVGVCWLLMGLLVPIDAGAVYALLAASLIADSIAQRRVAWRLVRRAIVAGLIAAPVLIYSFLMFTLDPILAIWSAQNVLLSPSPLHYLAAYLFVGILAIIGLRKNPHSETRNPKLIGWLIIIPIMIYLPFSFQRRLIESWQIPLCLFAAIGLVYRLLPLWRRSRLVRRLALQPRYSVRGLSRWAIALLLFVSSATYVLLLSEQATRLLAQQPPAFRDGGEISALDWLNRQTTYDDVVLSAYDTGNFLPTQVAARVFLGHGPETVHSDQKRELVAEFFKAATPNATREKFLRDWPITYVFYGPLEKQLGVIDLLALNDLSLVYDQGGYQIYKVTSNE
jgi:hypothetical protein